MKPNQVISLALIALGTTQAVRTLRKRIAWENENRFVNLVVDYDDAQAVSIRAGIPLAELYEKIRAHGASHISLPELSLKRLLLEGRIALTTPRAPIRKASPVGHWNYFATNEIELLEHILTELHARVPQSAARRIGKARVFAFAGDLQTIGEIGLGFESARADEIRAAGLRVVPRPLSFAWVSPPLIHRTLAQAARVGDGVVAFDGEIILGHEMHLAETVAALKLNNLAFAYFAESRHQKGDWFIAKQRMPAVIVAHQMSRAEMSPIDFHSAAHQWSLLVRERGIRFIYVNFFRVIHATNPLEGLHYIEHIVEALEADGYRVADKVWVSELKIARDEIIASGFVAAGMSSLALNETLKLREPFASALSLTSAVTPFALNYLDRPRNELERHYPPSYATKMLALATTISTPIAATKIAQQGLGGLLAASALDASAATVLSALTADTDYLMRVEEYRGFDLDAWLPLAANALSLHHPREKFFAGITAFGGWLFTRARFPDPFGRLDRAHAEGHTHHLSASARLIGDAQRALGPRPGRKWAWLAPLGSALAQLFVSRGQRNEALVASTASVLGRELLLTGFRKPERALIVTARTTGLSYLIGIALALFVLIVARLTKD